MTAYIAEQPREKRTYAVDDLLSLIGMLGGEYRYPEMVAGGDLKAASQVRREIATRAANETAGWVALDAIEDGTLWLPDQTANDLDAMLSPRSVEHTARLPVHWDARESVPLILCKHHVRPFYPLDPVTGFVWWVDARSDSMLLRSLEAIGWLELTKVDVPF